MSDATSNPELKRSLDQVSASVDVDAEGMSEAKRARVVQEGMSKEHAPVASTSGSAFTSAAAADSNPSEPEGGDASDTSDIIISTTLNPDSKPIPSHHDKSKNKRPEKKKDSKKKSRGRGPGSRRTRNEEDALKDGTKGEGEGADQAPKALRYPKRQCALLVGFCGSGYSGMQMCVSFLMSHVV